MMEVRLERRQPVAVTHHAPRSAGNGGGQDGSPAQHSLGPQPSALPAELPRAGPVRQEPPGAGDAVIRRNCGC
jgi:hypothetical protein